MIIISFLIILIFYLIMHSFLNLAISIIRTIFAVLFPFLLWFFAWVSISVYGEIYAIDKFFLEFVIIYISGTFLAIGLICISFPLFFLNWLKTIGILFLIIFLFINYLYFIYEYLNELELFFYKILEYKINIINKLLLII